MILPLSSAELSSWRENIVTKTAISWLQQRIGFFQQEIPEYLVRNKLDEARAAAGALKGFQEVLVAFLEEPVLVAEEPEEKFTDPATRPSTMETT